jgi:hypothetical protein
MQTFLPYPDFERSAQVLDYRRLGKQRVEARQILNALAGRTKGWINHPAVRMWRGHETALKAYYNTMVEEWIRRGYNNTMTKEKVDPGWNPPPWLNKAFCAAHRSNLLRKDPEFYGRLGWSEPDDLPYLWPA